ncbi:hypothetical protein CPB84DRAFT_1849321 [Gymnopilus junonius]|uniref:Uncharacterized protein n=1 Tax=Gymnopilus junonius TaxID=109634 RepID=A0A9P5TL36_GYMJU|nr:hypothetical protein CPB84DRAFT_1849321 [Gymnopilus junonius]
MDQSICPSQQLTTTRASSQLHSLQYPVGRRSIDEGWKFHTLCKGLLVQINKEPKNSYSFVQLLFRSKWDKIRSLRITLNGRGYSDIFLDALRRPAYSLEIFDFTAPDDLPPLEGELFSGRAPRLLEFSYPDLILTWEQPWLHRLHKVELPSGIDASRVIEILGNMPLLEDLVLHDIEYSEHSPRGSISMPRLAQIHITAIFDATVAILEAIITSQACGLDLTIRVRASDTLTEERLLAARCVLSRYSTSYFPGRPLHYLDLSLYDGGILIRDAPLEEPGDHFAIVVLGLRDNPALNPIQSLVIGLFAISVLRQVAKFFLSCEFRIDGPWEDIKQDVADLTKELISVVKLKVFGAAALGLFITGEDATPTQWSFIRELELEGIWFPDWEGRLAYFLEERRGKNAMVEQLVIHFRPPIEKEEIRALRFLERVAGTVVTFWIDDKRVEYICGSGRIQTIFRKPSSRR